MTFGASCIQVSPCINLLFKVYCTVLFTFTEQSWLHVANSDFEFGFQSNPWILDKWAAMYCTGDVPSCSEKCGEKALPYMHLIQKKLNHTYVFRKPMYGDLCKNCSYKLRNWKLTLMSQILSSPSWVVANIFSDSLFHFTW